MRAVCSARDLSIYLLYLYLNLGVVLRRDVVLRGRVVLRPQPRVRGGRKWKEEDEACGIYVAEGS